MMTGFGQSADAGLVDVRSWLSLPLRHDTVGGCMTEALVEQELISSKVTVKVDSRWRKTSTPYTSKLYMITFYRK